MKKAACGWPSSIFAHTPSFVLILAMPAAASDHRAGQHCPRQRSPLRYALRTSSLREFEELHRCCLCAEGSRNALAKLAV